MTLEGGPAVRSAPNSAAAAAFPTAGREEGGAGIEEDEGDDDAAGGGALVMAPVRTNAVSASSMDSVRYKSFSR